MKIKIFQTGYGHKTAEGMEARINEWLENEKPKIIQVLQSDTRAPKPGGVGVSDYYLTITFLYE